MNTKKLQLADNPPSSFLNSIAIALRYKRLIRGLPLQKVSTEVGITAETLQLIEAGEIDLDIPTMLVLCEKLGTSFQQVIEDAQTIEEKLEQQHSTMMQSIATQQQLTKLERQQRIVLSQLTRLKIQVEMMRKQYAEMATLGYEASSRNHAELQERLEAHHRVMSKKVSQMEKSRQWCDENERFYCRRLS